MFTLILILILFAGVAVAFGLTMLFRRKVWDDDICSMLLVLVLGVLFGLVPSLLYIRSDAGMHAEAKEEVTEYVGRYRSLHKVNPCSAEYQRHLRKVAEDLKAQGGLTEEEAAALDEYVAARCAADTTGTPK